MWRRGVRAPCLKNTCTIRSSISETSSPLCTAEDVAEEGGGAAEEAADCVWPPLSAACTAGDPPLPRPYRFAMYKTPPPSPPRPQTDRILHVLLRFMSWCQMEGCGGCRCGNVDGIQLTARDKVVLRNEVDSSACGVCGNHQGAALRTLLSSDT